MGKYSAHQWVAARMPSDGSPDSYGAAGAANTTYVDGKGYRELLWTFLLGDFSATGTVFFQCQECATSGGSYTDITGARAPASSTYSITQANKVYTGRIDLMQRMRYHEVQYDVDTDSVEFAVMALLLDPVEAPATQTQTNVFTVGA